MWLSCHASHVSLFFSSPLPASVNGSLEFARASPLSPCLGAFMAVFMASLRLVGMPLATAGMLTVGKDDVNRWRADLCAAAAAGAASSRPASGRSSTGGDPSTSTAQGASEWQCEVANTTARHEPIANDNDDVSLLDESVISVDGAERDDSAEPWRRSRGERGVASDSTSSPSRARRSEDIYFLWVFFIWDFPHMSRVS